MAAETGATADRAAAVASEGELVEAVRDAYESGVPLRIVGGGSWRDAGRPVTAERTVDLSAMRGIVEYVPGDLTLTARAGTTLAAIDDATREHGQWLPLDPFGANAGTLGATLATASAGPLAGSVGLPRDVALGVSFVDGRAQAIRGGGRVVKNVAGFDLVRLAVGAWGTLGILTEATVRLRGRPEADESVTLELPDRADDLAPRLRAIRQAPIAPLAAELLSPRLATRIGAGSAPALLVRLAGNADAVRAQRAALARLAEVRDVSGTVWQRLQVAEPEGVATLRLSGRPSDLPQLWERVQTLASRHEGEAHASLERGIARCWFPSSATERIAAALAEIDPVFPRIFERLPADWWPRLAAPADDRIARALRDAFDPRRLLNRGILGPERS